MPSAESALKSGVQDYTWPFGRKHRWSRRIFVLLILLILVATGFRPEVVALAWHLRHGNTFDFHGVRFHIAKRAYVQHVGWTEDIWEVRSEIGWGRSALGKRAEVFSLQYLPDGMIAKAAADQKSAVQRRGFQLLAERRTAMVGAMLVCTEYLDPGTQNHHVYCDRTTSGPLPQYAGPADGVADFYRFINSATSVAAPTTADAP